MPSMIYLVHTFGLQFIIVVSISFIRPSFYHWNYNVMVLSLRMDPYYAVLHDFVGLQSSIEAAR